jgi:beta-xylosidase
MNDPFPKFAGFTYSPALAFEEGVTRRDPSPVIFADGCYHVWYSKNVEGNPFPHDGWSASIWHATSLDGVEWEEEAEALPRGGQNAFDELGVFTPTILIADNRYYLYYTAMPRGWLEGRDTTKGAIGVATSPSPFGPWERCGSEPILRCSDDPQAFDSLRVDDSCIIARNGEYRMYYKGRQWDGPPTETKMGLATAKDPAGPWTKYEENPVLDSGHEVCVWPHGKGIGCLVCDVGPQGNTLQYSEDGVVFRKISDTVPPGAPGPFRADGFVHGEGPGMTWGISMVHHHWPYLVRFDCDLKSKNSPEHL